MQNLGLVLFVENNLWGYSTPADMQFRVKDLAERAIAYGIPGVIVDGTDACQVYDAAHEACERARRGEGPTLIEAKMMRMKGHAIHDAAEYVPKPLFEYWRKRDCIARFENYLVNVKKWLTSQENAALIADVERVLEEDRDFAVNSPMPTPESAAGGVYCEDGCHEDQAEVRCAESEEGKRRFKANRSGGAFQVDVESGNVSGETEDYRYTSRRWPMVITENQQHPTMHSVNRRGSRRLRTRQVSGSPDSFLHPVGKGSSRKASIFDAMRFRIGRGSFSNCRSAAGLN